VNRRGQVVFANAEAERVLAQRDGLAVEGGRLAAMRTSENDALDRFMGMVVHVGSGEDRFPGGVIRVPRPSGLLDYGMEVGPVGKDGVLVAFKGVSAIVTITDPAPPVSVDADRLSRVFNLTRAEARVAAGLMEGRGTR